MPVLNSPTRGGMTRQRLIQLADQRTSRIAHGKLNLDQEFLALLQDFCSEYSWSWRKYSTAFDTEPETYIYNIGVSPLAARGRRSISGLTMVWYVLAPTRQ
jgi:hypothetical protein